MVFPKLNAKASNTLKINDFSGGINLRDGLTEILDNQSTDVTNMYWKDGIMKTRPASDFKYQIPHDGFKPTSAGQNFTETKVENATIIMTGKLYRMVSRHDWYNKSVDGQNWSSEVSHLSFAWVNGTEYEALPTITSETGTTFTNYFVAQHKKDIFCFCKTSDNEGVIYKLGTDTWAKVNEDEMYVPVVLTHAKPQDNFMPSVETLIADGAVMLEGFNLLSGTYKMIWSTVNKRLLGTWGQDPDTHLMRGYALLYPINGEQYAGKKVVAKITSKSGTVYTHEVTLTGDPLAQETINRGDDVYLRVAGRMITFSSDASHSNPATVSEEDYVEDNMEIIAPYIITEKETQKVFSMTQSEWFGGDALGISGGTRLFLCGNTNNDEKSLVLWSGLDNPLYFPENCYAYVGNSNQAVTGFGRQNDTLVIFKERETYYTQYMQNTNITAEDLINQNIVDYAASSVYFPMVQLHPNIGCDLPDTIQLCRNRLVWASTTGKVYTLMAQNQYSERNIYELSGMIENKLIKESLLNSCACDWNGYYLLFAGNSVYAMDYESYGYVYASSYNKTEDANIKIPWWYWTLNNNVSSAFTVDNDVVLCTLNGVGVPEDISQYFYLFDEEKAKDTDNTDEYDILSSFTSKLFDFNEPNKRKNIDCINISFGNNDGQPITVVVTSDSGEDEQIISLDSGEDDNRLSGYITSKAIYPILPQICRLAVTIKCSGHLAVDGMSIKYRVTGGIR